MHYIPCPFVFGPILSSTKEKKTNTLSDNVINDVLCCMMDGLGFVLWVMPFVFCIGYTLACDMPYSSWKSNKETET